MCSRQERKWLERKKLHQDTKMFLMQCWYISLNTSLNELTRRNKTLVEDYHVQLSRKCLFLSCLFRLLRKRSGISGTYMDKKAWLTFRKETTVRYRSASMYHSNRN